MSVARPSQALTNKVFEKINARFPLKRQQGINLVTGIYTIDGEDDQGIPFAKFHQQPLIDDIIRYAGQEDGKDAHTPMKASWKMYNEDQLVRDKTKRKAKAYDLNQV